MYGVSGRINPYSFDLTAVGGEWSTFTVLLLNLPENELPVPIIQEIVGGGGQKLSG
jgi:hypothetical protein